MKSASNLALPLVKRGLYTKFSTGNVDDWKIAYVTKSYATFFITISIHDMPGMDC